MVNARATPGTQTLPGTRPDLRTLSILILFLGLLCYSLLRPLYTVHSPEHGDQAAYLELAANIREGRGFVSRGLSPFQPAAGIEHPEGVRAPL